jgi:hypothetical protein
MTAAPSVRRFQDDGGAMSKYMLLLYRNEPNQQEREERNSEMPLWIEFEKSLRDAGLLLSSDPLYPVDAATTVRVRDGETEIVDGPFAVTKENLGGYFLLECADLDQALKQAARVPLARYGSVEVRPVMDRTQLAPPEEAAAAAP